MIPTLEDIRKAATALQGQVLRTPTLPAPKLSLLTGANVFVKYENLQVTNAFKERGAYIKLSRLKKAERNAGVIAMSAGNHAQAVAYHAQRLGIPATIIMPTSTPHVKVEATRAYGAHVLVEGETLDDAKQAAEREAQTHGLTWVHPYDDWDVVCGQGSIAIEMLEDVPDLDTLIVPVGGGGLIGGMSVAAKGLNPHCEVIGVEVETYPAMIDRLEGRDPQCGGNTLAEGIAVKYVGELPLEIVKHNVDDIVLVSESQIEQAINFYLTYQKTMAEGAGAAGLAAMIASPQRFKGKNVGLVMCGGNIDPRILASITVRALSRQNKLVALRINIPDKPGVLGEISTLLGNLGANILEVSHHRLFLKIPVKGTSVDITIETKNAAHAQQIIDALQHKGYDVTRIEVGSSEYL
jgi:threonine dehydratase